MTQFGFLRAEWQPIFESSARCEAAVYADPRTSCFYARRALELAVAWLFKHDSSLQLPYQDNISALIHEPTFKQTVGEAVFSKARVIVTLGNRAVHGHRAIPTEDALVAVRELFHICYWLGRSYGRVERPADGLAFNPLLLLRPAGSAQVKQNAEQLQLLEVALREKDEKLTVVLADKAALDAELQRLRAEVAAAKKAAAEKPDAHDYSEAQTRDYFIDLLLKEAGWALDQPRDREFEVVGMPNNKGKGFVDYVLWGDDGKPLGLVEAKRTRRDSRVGQQQAKLYADCLEKAFDQRPVIFYSNGYEHWIWDDVNYPPRAVQGFYSKADLQLLIQRRTSRRPLASVEVNTSIVERFYQSRAIRRIAESFDRDHDRKALLVMATGAGKTRTVVALADMLIRANAVKRVLFLADRVALVGQAVNAFNAFLPESSPVNLVTEREGEGRVYVSTYPTMMGLIDERHDGQRRFGVGHFDLVIIDEAHRSVFQKYRAIFDYFDSLLVGLTATPREEIDRNTYGLFDLENGVPTDEYSLDQAIKDGFLVPPKTVSVPLKFQREGIKYDDLSEDDKDQWDALEWDEEGGVPHEVDAQAVNKWLFNKDTVDKVLEHLMTRGITVAGGDRLAKTILFAKNQAHADFISDRFNANYPHYKGDFARVITFKTEYAQSLIDAFKLKEKSPHIALSVDMLDTGIDVPEVANLVFFKLVRSKTKFWQMLGRGTRLCPDLFGPGQHKKAFQVFDYCQNLEYFSQNPDAADGASSPSLGKKLFTARLEVIGELDKRVDASSAEATKAAEGGPTWAAIKTETDVRSGAADSLHREVASMNMENFVVRPKRRLVEEYAKRDVWDVITPASLSDLATEVAGLPNELDPEGEEAKRFDLLVLNLQLAVLRTEPAFARLRDQVKAIAGLLEEKSAIPMINQHMPLIQDVQTDEWWQDVTLPILEVMRRRLRDLVVLIEKRQRKILFTDFEDEIGDGTDIVLPGLDITEGSTESPDFAKFRVKVRAYLRAHEDHITVHKLRRNVPLTAMDLAELERMLAESGLGPKEQIEKAKTDAKGLGLFVRSLIGLDREAAKSALSGFVSGKSLQSSQIDFVNLIVNHLTEHGVMEAARLYESPFTDLAPSGPEALFTSSEVDALINDLANVRANAEAA